MKNLILTFSLVLVSFSGFAQLISPQLIEVEGTSEINVLPDEAQLHVTLNEKAMNVAEVTNALNKKTKSIQDALKKSGVQDYDFNVDNYYVNVNRIYTRGSAKDSGYVASQNVKITVKNLDKDLVKVVETLHTTANMGFNIQFAISESQRKSYDQKLLEMAIDDARRKADIIANRLNIEDITIYRVNYGSGTNNYQPIMMRQEAMMVKSSDQREEPIFNPEEQKISDRVMVSYTFKTK
jgi:uncharacterized protein YggE